MTHQLREALVASVSVDFVRFGLLRVVYLRNSAPSLAPPVPITHPTTPDTNERIPPRHTLTNPPRSAYSTGAKRQGAPSLTSAYGDFAYNDQ